MMRIVGYRIRSPRQAKKPAMLQVCSCVLHARCNTHLVPVQLLGARRDDPGMVS